MNHAPETPPAAIREQPIMAIFFVKSWPSFNEEMVALFDERDITPTEVDCIIRADSYDKRVIIVSQEQYETVFRSLIEARKTGGT